jgi:hypothetical protein
LIEEGLEYVLSERGPWWGKHAEKRKKIIPIAKILRIIKFLLRVRENRGNLKNFLD